MLNIAKKYASFFGGLRCCLAPLFLLGIRLYIGWIFFKSGLTKLPFMNDSILWLFSGGSVLEAFEDGNYYVPFLPPELALFLATSGELILPVLLVFGLFGNLAALCLFGLNLVAVISFPTLWYGTLNPGIYDHAYWGVMLLTLTIYGAGKISIDAILCKIVRSDTPNT